MVFIVHIYDSDSQNYLGKNIIIVELFYGIYNAILYNLYALGNLES